MQISRPTEHVQPYKTLKTQFVSPYNKREVLLEVRMHKKIINNGFGTKILKQPIVTFHTTTDQAVIPERYWTDQMIKAVDAYANEYPVMDTIKRHSIVSKILSSISNVWVSLMPVH
ncbi:hypothetical protein D1818_01085 [Aquimarina sp. BL5]|uniref:hypothetical protein n=1 Tax=Aquimarina sp. BL5 TaxID=1714860 RepID=UPI000E4CBC34|nr:hypothetical protein [Aquimarina sp. BL5]AXT49480.1 hypothetical protein D1818_01085 [Aquimarina sp. BL5]RKN04376.1 hypothetical protein D7036_12330 [Aquimarina sp. BL5]